MKDEKYYDFGRSILDIAEDFYGAYSRCREGKNCHVDESGRTCYDVANVPAIVNGAFAIELYLKSISPSTEEELKKKRHYLKELFKSLEEKDQTAIRGMVEGDLKTLKCSFEKGFTIINNSFTFWRYIHTKPNTGYGLNKTLDILSVFLGAIRQYVNNKSGGHIHEK